MNSQESGAGSCTVMKGLTSCHCLTIITLLVNINGSYILTEGMSQRNNTRIVVDLNQYCGVCPANGLCPYFMDLVHTQYTGGLKTDGDNHLEEGGFLTHSLQLRNYILLLRIRRHATSEPRTTTTGQNISKPTSGLMRGKQQTSQQMTMPPFQGHIHRAKTINTSPHCTQKELATTYIITQDGHGHRAYLYDRSKKKFQPSGFHTTGKCRAAFLDILTSFFYWADMSGIKRSCVSGGDVHTVISIPGSTDDISIDSNRALLFFTHDRSGKSKICCIDMNKKRREVLTKRTVGPILMSLDTEKQILYWKVLYHNKLYTLVYGDNRGSASTYTLLSNCGRHESYFTYFPDKSIITCCQKTILIMKLESKKTQRIHLRRHHDCEFVHVTNNQIHVLSHHRLLLFTLTGRPLAVIKYPTKRRYWLIKFY